MAITAHLILVLYPLLLRENNCMGALTPIYIVHE